MARSLEDILTLHSIFVQRLAGGQYNKLAPIIDDLLKDIQTRILTATPTQATRLKTLEREINAIVKRQLNLFADGLAAGGAEFASYELGFVTRALDSNITVAVNGLNTDAIAASLTERPMNLLVSGGVDVLTLTQATETFTATVTKDVMRKIRNGVVFGDTTETIARDVGRLVNNRTKAQAESLTRTYINHLATESRNEVYKANSDVLSGEVFRATLDYATTITCAGFDGKVFPLGVGPMPPLHWGCRSGRIARVKPQLEVPGVRKVRESVEGPVSGKVTYNSFLKRARVDAQNEVLGVTRAKLFRSGKLSVEKFTDETGRVLTLKELAEKENLVL